MSGMDKAAVEPLSYFLIHVLTPLLFSLTTEFYNSSQAFLEELSGLAITGKD